MVSPAAMSAKERAAVTMVACGPQKTPQPRGRGYHGCVNREHEWPQNHSFSGSWMLDAGWEVACEG